MNISPRNRLVPRAKLATLESPQAARGLSRMIEELTRSDEGPYYEEAMVFVAMAFDVPAQMSDTYHAIKRACEVNELRALRIDEIQNSGPNPFQIMKAIEDAHFLVF